MAKPTKAELLEQAKELNIEGVSDTNTVAEIQAAIDAAGPASTEPGNVQTTSTEAPSTETVEGRAKRADKHSKAILADYNSGLNYQQLADKYEVEVADVTAVVEADQAKNEE